jgi:hypothetical protein
MPKERRLSESEVVDAFTDHHEVIEANRMWAQGHLSDRGLIERLTYLKMFIDTTPVEVEEEGLDDPWEAA